MARKIKKLSVTKEIKAIARERIGAPKPARPLRETPPDRKKKHKKPAGEIDGND